MIKISYVVSDLKRVGPTKQTLNIIKHAGNIENSVVVTLFPEGDDSLYEEYSELGISVRCLNLTRKNVITSGPYALKSFLRQNDTDIVHSYGIFPDYVSQKATKDINKIHHLITLRNNPIEDAPTRMFPPIGLAAVFFHLSVLKRASNVVVCSKSLAEAVKTKYSWARHFGYIQNGVDLSIRTKTAEASLALPSDGFKCLSAASMIPRKRINDLIDGFLKAFPKKNDGSLVLLGDGPLLDKLKDEYKTYKNVIFMGKVAEVGPYYQWADLFLSASESEGMPNSVIESIACGTPVVLSDIPQHSEVFDLVPGCGFLFELGNVNSLHDTLLKASNEDLKPYKKMCESIESSPLSMIYMACRYKELYLSLCERLEK